MHALLTLGFFLWASGNAFAQRHPGWPEGPLNSANGNGQAAAPQYEARANQPAIRNDRPAIRNERPTEHPFYNNEHGRENDWRYGYHDNRWWYWTPGNAWAYYDNGRWQDYNEGVPYTTNYRGPTTAPNGWYWSNNEKRWYWFDGSTLQAAQQ